MTKIDQCKIDSKALIDWNSEIEVLTPKVNRKKAVTW